MRPGRTSPAPRARLAWPREGGFSKNVRKVPEQLSDPFAQVSRFARTGLACNASLEMWGFPEGHGEMLDGWPGQPHDLVRACSPLGNWPYLEDSQQPVSSGWGGGTRQKMRRRPCNAPSPRGIFTEKGGPLLKAFAPQL